MSYNYTLKYRTFNQLLADVEGDFKKYQLADLVDPMDMIKVAKRVNYDLGLRIFKTKEIILEVEKGKVRLPNDFYVLNFALMCGDYTTKQYMPQGTHIEERPVSQVAVEYTPPPPEIIEPCVDPVEVACPACDQCGDPCCNPPCYNCCANPLSCALTCDDNVIQLVQVLTYQTRTFSFLSPIKILENPMEIDCDCPNLYWQADISGYIKEGWLYTSFETGQVYINYQGMLEDDDGNILVLDHDGINEYYEYALKQRIVENLIMNDEKVNPTKLQLIEQRYRTARNFAMSVVNTPNFNELKKTFKMNRKAMYSKYYDMFRSYI